MEMHREEWDEPYIRITSSPQRMEVNIHLYTRYGEKLGRWSMTRGEVMRMIERLAVPHQTAKGLILLEGDQSLDAVQRIHLYGFLKSYGPSLRREELEEMVMSIPPERLRQIMRMVTAVMREGYGGRAEMLRRRSVVATLIAYGLEKGFDRLLHRLLRRELRDQL